jgi:hypothetical protein
MIGTPNNADTAAMRGNDEVGRSAKPAASEE